MDKTIINNKNNKLTVFQRLGITKNRYEILFFNKFELVLTLLLLKNLEILKMNKLNNNNLSTNNILITDKQNKEKINDFQNKIVSRILDEEEINQEKSQKNIMKNIKKIYNNNPISYIKEEDLKFLYSILRNICYLRAYFRYSNESTLQQRFNNSKDNSKKNSEKKKADFKFVYNKIQNYFKKKMMKDTFNKYNKKNQKNNDILSKDFQDTLEKTLVPEPLDSDNEIKKILSGITSKSNNDKIESALQKISEQTGGYINCCFIFDIKKTKLTSINSVNVYFFDKKINEEIVKENLNKKSSKLGEMWLILFIVITILVGAPIYLASQLPIGATAFATLALSKVIPIIIGIILIGLFITFITVFNSKFIKQLKYIDFNSLLISNT
jgi:hypothetical protein